MVRRGPAATSCVGVRNSVAPHESLRQLQFLQKGLVARIAAYAVEPRIDLYLHQVLVLLIAAVQPAETNLAAICRNANRQSWSRQSHPLLLSDSMWRSAIGPVAGTRDCQLPINQIANLPKKTSISGGAQPNRVSAPSTLVRRDLHAETMRAANPALRRASTVISASYPVRPVSAAGPRRLAPARSRPVG